MSRQELADAASVHLAQPISGHYIAKLERGELRWPAKATRDALRRVLGATHDHDLGFYINRTALPTPRAMAGGGRAEPAKERGETEQASSRWRAVSLGMARDFFGAEPVTVAVPLRAMAGRVRPVISSEDAQAAEAIGRLLADLRVPVASLRIPTHGLWQPSGGTVAICGPKSSAITAKAIETDPFLAFEPDAQGVWAVRERDSSRTYTSLLDQPTPEQVDVAYVGRLPVPDGTFLVIAGVHALGSLGAVDYLARHLTDLHATVGTSCFSTVVRSAHDGDRVTHSELLAPVRVHP